MIHKQTILDCYTDEPAGLGVPPYLGVHPRYIAGALKGKVNYITIDDLRLYYQTTKKQKKRLSKKTDITTYNLTRKSIKDILEKTKELYVVIGIQTPGKYLSALPGTLREVTKLIRDLRCRKIFCGPGISGTQLEGGKRSEQQPKDIFDATFAMDFSTYDDLAPLAIKGAVIAKQIPWKKMIEIETGRGCIMGKCSFCTEPLKARAEWREQRDIHQEIKTFYDQGERYIRLGKQACFFSYKRGDAQAIKKLLAPIGRESTLGLHVLHIDNVIPGLVTEERTKLVVQHCTEGNIAAFGIETFDKNVVKENTLNTSPEIALRAIKIINKFGSKRGPNGMHYFLPGINIVFGLKGESKETGELNMQYLQKIFDENLLLRRINIRQVTPFPGTPMWGTGMKFLRKNKKRYWQWRMQIRKTIDHPMLQRLVPIGTVLRNVQMEVHDGNHTFGRQMGTYSLIIGVKKKLPLRQFYDLTVTGHMLRSVVGEPLHKT